MSILTSASRKITNSSFPKCFAIIKRNNPTIFSRESNSRSSIVIGDIGIPDKLSNLRLNRSLVAHLDIVYRYTQNIEKLRDNLDIMKSLSDDIKYVDITRWFLPNYKNILTILSLKGSIGEPHKVQRLFHCFQLLIASFCCFQADALQLSSKLILETLISRFVSQDLIVCKQKSSRIVQQYLRTDEAVFDLSSTRMQCKIHCETLISIMNLNLRVVGSSVSHKNGTRCGMQFFLIISRICFVIESLTHCLINQLSSTPDKSLTDGLAYREQYCIRERTFDFQYTNNILFVLRERTSKVKERLELLKGIISELLKVLNHLDWFQLDDYVKQYPIHSETMIKRRLYIQITLLIAADLNLISEFRLIRWPTWSKPS